MKGGEGKGASSNKRFGFVRFTDQDDQREALIHMNGFRGLGNKPIKVSIAVPKPGLVKSDDGPGMEADSMANPVYSQYYERYWTDRGAWGNYGSFRHQQQQQQQPLLLSANAPTSLAAINSDTVFDEEEQSGDDERIVDHDQAVNVDAMNAEFIARSEEVWDASEKERWIYDLDNDDGCFVPNFSKNRKKTN